MINPVWWNWTGISFFVGKKNGKHNLVAGFAVEAEKFFSNHGKSRRTRERAGALTTLDSLTDAEDGQSFS
ncbi:hypothetical protein [Desulforudis sp. DRI-14]|uniref:hypothetical protein n=1 Tax=Desulforudis sp. DRI-14 TaxID=3459793 RepID=UPI0040427B44